MSNGPVTASHPTRRRSPRTTWILPVAVLAVIGLPYLGGDVIDAVPPTLGIGLGILFFAVVVVGGLYALLAERRARRALLERLESETHARGLVPMDASWRARQLTPVSAWMDPTGSAGLLPRELSRQVLGGGRGESLVSVVAPGSSAFPSRHVHVGVQKVKRDQPGAGARTTDVQLHLVVATTVGASGEMLVTPEPRGEGLSSLFSRLLGRSRPPEPDHLNDPFEAEHGVTGDAELTQYLLDASTRLAWDERFASATVAVREGWLAAAIHMRTKHPVMSPDEAAQALTRLVEGVTDLADRLDERWPSNHAQEEGSP